MADTSKIRISGAFDAICGAIVRAGGPVFDFLTFRSTGRSPREVPRSPEARRLSLSEQWHRLSEIVMGAATRAEEAARCHASATLQLDLAQYALTSLVDELSAVMDVGGRRRGATLHVLGVAPASPRPTMGDAIAA
ncbi:hypothetical protein [Hyphomicrobium sp.]|uniref:hypothetical protein n=1 Tax=Hyphomicrobium sp. TaxID=82 RepID=UPI002D77EB97|nr:hypothetical protein [Hyphomicrobium sp.]HET6388898.1 hypothetical protein [Hyphomicrobium sp.]